MYFIARDNDDRKQGSVKLEMYDYRPQQIMLKPNERQHYLERTYFSANETPPLLHLEVALTWDETQALHERLGEYLAQG